jgi:putative PEP-CTERM system TPR-repeat lipoprotein
MMHLRFGMEEVTLALLVMVGGMTSGCSKQDREAKFLQEGKNFLERKDYQRAVLQFKNAIQAVPNDAEPHYQVSLAYLAIGDYRSALVELQRAIKLNPKHLAAQVKLSEIYTATTDKNFWQEAENRLHGVLAAAPDNVDALNTLAIAEWELGDQQQAEEHLRVALTKAPQNVQTLVSIAKLKMSRNDVAGAERILREAGEKSSSADVLVALAQFYILTGNFSEAESNLRRVLQLAPHNGAALLNMAYLQYRAGRRQEEENTYKQIAALDGKEYKHLHAMYLLRNGKVNEAIGELQQLAKRDPADRDARSRLVWAYLAADRFTEVEKLLTVAIAKDAKDAAALLQRSALLIQVGRDAEAQADLTQLLRLRPESAEGHYLLARLHQRRGSSVLQRQELAEALKHNPRLLPARIELARNFLQTNASHEALNILTEAPEDQKSAIPFITEKNWALLQTGDLTEARKGVNEILAKRRTPDVLRQDALLKWHAGSYEQARKSLREALERNSEDLSALTLLVATYEDQKQAPAALKEVRDYAQREPKSAAILNFLGTLLVKEGDRTEARAALMAAKAANPNFASVDLSLARLDVADGRLDDGLKKLQTLSSQDPTNWLARLWAGHVQEIKGNHEAALAQYRKVLEIQDDNWVALNNMAFLLADFKHQPNDALKYAEKAKELKPDDPSVSDTLGWVLYQKGLYSNALPYLEDSVSKQPSSRRKYHLAMAYLKAGNTELGRATLQAALKTERNFPEAQSAQEVLAKTR